MVDLTGFAPMHALYEINLNKLTTTVTGEHGGLSSVVSESSSAAGGENSNQDFSVLPPLLRGETVRVRFRQNDLVAE
jgi:hypothetical protein